MGLFSSKKKIYVASSVYNLAGDVNLRPNYLKSIVQNYSINPTGSITINIANSYLNGPAVKLQLFSNWSKKEYINDIGFTSEGISRNLDISLITNEVPHLENEIVLVSSAVTDQGIYTYWADQYMLDNHPALLNSDWKCDYKRLTDTITITFEDTTTVSFNPNLDSNSRYIFTLYKLATVTDSEAVITSPVEIVTTFSSRDDWDVYSNITDTIDVDLDTITTTVSSFSDGRPNETTSTTTTVVENTTTFVKVYEQHVPVIGTVVDEVKIKRITYTHTQTKEVVTNTSITTTTVDIGGGVTRTDVTTTDTDSIVYTKTTQLTEQILYTKSWSNLKLYIYKENTGNAVLDNIIQSSYVTENTFYPFIPVRIDNEFISVTHPDIYTKSKKAFKKVTSNGNLDTIIEQISDNESLGDIDYTYVMFGVPLNVKENASKEYLYNFFVEMRNQYGNGIADFDSWLDSYNAAKASIAAWEAWRQSWNENSVGTEPTVLPYPELKNKSVRLYSTNASLAFDMELSWSGIQEEFFTGIGKTGALPGDVWLTKGNSITYDRPVYGYSDEYIQQAEALELKTIYIYYQTTSNTYKRLKIIDLLHRNTIYQGHYVTIDSHQALDDVEESGFLIPLHDTVYKNTRLINATQMTTACSYLVFNSYQVVKIKWYQTGLFKVLLIIAVIVYVAYTGDFATAEGLLGTALEVGMQLGFTGTVAIIVGLAVNAIAAMALAKVLTKALTPLVGKDVATFLSALITFALSNPDLVNSFNQGMQAGFNELMKAENLLKLTSAISEGYTGYVQANLAKLSADTSKYIDTINEELKNLNEMSYEQFGNNGTFASAIYDLTNTYKANLVVETPNTFLTRTLLTGSDIVDISHNMINKYTEINLNTTLPV